MLGLVLLVAAAIGAFGFQRSLLSAGADRGGPERAAENEASGQTSPSLAASAGSAASPGPESDRQEDGLRSGAIPSIAAGLNANGLRDIKPAEAPSPFDFDESEAPDRARVQDALEFTLAEHFVDHRLSSDEIERATDSLVSLRAAQEALRTLPFGPETADERRALVEQIGEATSVFEDVLDMDPAEFTAEAAASGLGGGGIDAFDPQENVPPAEFIERRP